ncbi:hypothetical protein GCM10027418_28500 [Mariniluteicoccus endophyticus]
MRARLVRALFCAIVLGLAGRALPGLVGDVTGSILYTVAVALAVALVRPGWGAGVPAVVGVVVSWCIEALQYAGLAARAAAAFPPARLLLGTTFVVWDLAAYVVGGLVAYPVLRLVSPRPRPSSAQGP